MAQLQGISGGKLNVAVISAGDYFFPQLLADSPANPGVTFNLTVTIAKELLAATWEQT